MNTLRAILSLDDPFRGFVPLLQSKRRALKSTFLAPFVVYLGFGLITLLVRGSSIETAGTIQGAWLVVGILAMIFLPIALGGYTTFASAVTPAGGRCRREEMLTLPIGRLAIPAMILTVSVLGVGAWILGSMAGTLVGFGPGTTWLALTGSKVSEAIPYAIPVLLAVFTGSVAFTAIGNNNAMLNLGWGLVPLAIGMALAPMGYHGDVLPYLWLWCVPVTLFHLILPFCLYALPPHHWSDTKADRHALDMVAQLVAYPVIALLPLMGWTWFVIGLVPAGGLLWLCARRTPKPEIRSVSGLRVGLSLGLLAILPPLAVCLAVDACVMSTPITQAQAHVVRAVPSPDGRLVALEVQPRLGGSDFFNDLKMSRVVVVDPSGETPPRRLAPRFGEIGGWSTDGAYLAVHDKSVGRFEYEEESIDWTRLGFWGRLRKALSPAVARTLIYDVAKQEVTHDLPRKQVKEGWTRPDQLVHFDVAVRRNKLLLKDGTGRALELDPVTFNLVLVQYGSEGPILARVRRGKGVEPWVIGVGTTRLERFRWGTSGLVPLEIEGRPVVSRFVDDAEKAKRKAWVEAMNKAKLEGKGRPKKTTFPTAYRITRSDATIDVREVYRLLYGSYQDDSILAIAPEGIVQISLPSGARTVLIPGSKLKEVPAIQHGVCYVSSLEDRTVILQGPDWTPRVLPVVTKPRMLKAVLPNGVLLADVGSEVRLISAKGQRPLLPR